jgi:hypothetical protein
MPQPPQRSPRAARNERDARILRIAAGSMVVVVLAAAGWGVTWMRKRRAESDRDFKEAQQNLQAVLDASTADLPEPQAAETAPTTQPREFRADATITAIRAQHQDGSVQGVWRASQALRAEAAAWTKQGAPETEINKLLAAVLDGENWILRTKPSFPELRKARGETRWPEILGDYEDLDARFLTKAESARLTRVLKQFEQLADGNEGWVVLADYEATAAPLVRRALDFRRDFDAMLGTRVGRAARETEIRELAELRNVLPGARFRVFYHLPHVLIVELEDRWEESEEALRVARLLLGLRKTFFEVYGSAMGLKPDDQRPVPVIVFTTREAYHHYGSARKMKDVAGTEAHFEPKSERLVLHHDCATSTLLHEGTHQLIRANIPRPLETYQQSFWFHEGVAEWFAGARQLADGPDGLPRFQIGLLLPNDVERREFLGPLAVIGEVPKANRFSLDELLGLMLRDREKLAVESASGQKRIRLVYAQGWFLIYFLDHFAVDSKGIVQVGAPGRYRDVWLRYLKREMEGVSGKKAFLEVLGSSGANLAAIEADLDAYLGFVTRKLAKGEVRDQQLVPAANPEDDRLK